jgi:uncharacterized protein YkwD
LLTRRARLFTVLVLVLSAAASTRPAPVHAVGQFSGTVPGPGGLALLVWSGGPVQEIGSALAATACSPRSVWATRRSGGLIGYLFGAPDAVNSGFRAEFAGATLPPQTPVVLVCAGASAPAPTAGALEQSEAQMFALINQARAANGLAPFTLDPALVEVARRHSADMVARGFFAHINPDGLDPFERMAAAGITYSSAAENIGWAGDATLAHNALMNSPVHRANLLNPQLGRIGVGIVRKDSLHIMVTQLFRD